MNWRKATHSGDNGGECIEASLIGSYVVALRHLNSLGEPLRSGPAAPPSPATR